MKITILAFAAMLGALGASQPAWAFGTVRGDGQNAEHERITRHALSCGLIATADCFENKSLTELAGDKDNFGAIGIPDRGQLILDNKAHCDSGDYLDIPGYPRNAAEAQAALERCRAWMTTKLHEAVSDAGDLVGAGGNLRDSQMAIPCLFVGQVKGHAKCDVIEDLGILLHASQDFYSHTNWVDAPDASLPIGVDNPPGLNQRGRAPWLDLRNPDPPFPAGLISGCFEKPPETTHCNYDGGLHRVKHAVVNKDMGTIDPILGAGTTPRGRHDDNFAHAIDAAIDDTQDKWLTFRELLVQTYGRQAGTLMACAISHDDPMKDCAP
ncbi:MAG: CinY protein [Rhizomicrobium sp.]